MFIESFADVADNLRMQFKNFKEFEMQDPFYLIVTMIGMQGVVPSLRNGFYLDPRPIDDDFIQLPEIRLDPLGSSSIDPADILKPLLRALWNAFGLDRR
ncbi:hypothetical protein B1A99_24670 [Cohnella sp. CIP 111063]|nr:hypothetical protein B1A99_24670 [Cohnella sp. CIP 111063]